MTSGTIIWGSLLLLSIVGFIIAISFFGGDKKKANNSDGSDDS
jgi:beta-lactam-binding protein with PASTA domain